MSDVQLRLPFQLTKPERPSAPPTTDSPFDIGFVRRARARRYILRVLPGGEVTVTIPRRGSLREARAFAEKHRRWIDAQRLRLSKRQAARPWEDGTRMWFRGEQVTLRVSMDDGRQTVRFADQELTIRDANDSVQAPIEHYLRRLAVAELPPRLSELAAQHSLRVARVSIRNQRSRWGSCSSRGHVSLNWRLIQMPREVADYVMLHELMHVHQPNHSRRFWRLVANVCPSYKDAIRWIKTHALHNEE